MKKTNAIRILDLNKLQYEINEYSEKDGISGLEVAKNLNEDPKKVFKTLVTYYKNDYFVFIVPSTNELDLKKAAKAVNVKKIEMIPQKELFLKTGYVHGGCSPIGMKKQFKTVLHEEALKYEYIYISGGKIGVQIKMDPKDLECIMEISTDDIVKGE